jgi:acetyl-CoA C-acetyltransferase
VVSWRYFDPARLVAAHFGAEPAERWYPAMGGNTPQQLVNRAALAIAEGRCDVALVCGGESYRTRQSLRRAGGRRPEWTVQSDDETPTWGNAQQLDMGHPAEVALGIMLPTQCYPMFETALRHEAGRTAEEHQRFLGELWAGYAAVAATNPYAWDRTPWTAEEIGTVTPDNRLIGYPYTKRMVSNPDVDMASGLILCSAAEADRRGIARDRWIFPWSGSDGTDPYLSLRPSLVSSAAMRVAGGAALDLAGVDIDDVAHVDVYSCFPSAVELATSELGIDVHRPLTVYGGLPFAGGPWNNPVGHALAAMVEVLRADPGSIGLVTANGGIVQKHAFGVYSSEPPRAGGFRHAHPQFAIDAAEPAVELAEGYEGPATVEGWTVMHERDGSPARAHAALRTPDGARAWGVSTDADVMAHLEAADVAGAAATIGPDADLRLDG